jgi:hypothetical protein
MGKDRWLRDLSHRLGGTRSRRGSERQRQHFVHRSDGMERQPFAHVGRKLLEFTNISFLNHDVTNAAAMRGNRLLPQPANSQHATAQCYLAGHGRVTAHG